MNNGTTLNTYNDVFNRVKVFKTIVQKERGALALVILVSTCRFTRRFSFVLLHYENSTYINNFWQHLLVLNKLININALLKVLLIDKVLPKRRW